MKRTTISGLLIITFIAYAVYVKLGGASSNTVVVLPAKQTVATQDVPSSQTHASATTPAKTGQYRNGEYTGNVEDAYYGNVQVKIIISGGKISDVQFLDYPQDRNTSVRINSRATPILAQEAIQAQSANVDAVSGATATSEAFMQSLASALSQAI